MSIAAPARPRIRAAANDDADACGRIFFEAFASLASRHSFPTEPSSPEFTRFTVGHMLASDGFSSVVAEQDGSVVGCAFVDRRSTIAGVGPVVVDPAVQDAGVGRALMEAALELAAGAAGVRLVQTAYHYRSLALYAKLGFVVREPLSVVQGPPPSQRIPGLGVRPAREDDVTRCGELCFRAHGHDRSTELRGAIAAGTAAVVEGPDGICGYATGFGYGWHAVAESNRELFALLSSPEQYLGLGVLVPSRNSELLGWCLASGLRIVQQSTLMTIGLYNEPRTPYLPSILF